MKHSLIVMLLCGSIAVMAQSDEIYVQEYKRGKSILMYSYVQRNDSTYLSGYLKDKKTDTPVPGMNIIVKGFAIGTVSDPDGNFRLFLPRREGIIIFDKTGFDYFEFPYRYKREKLKEHSAHH